MLNDWIRRLSEELELDAPLTANDEGDYSFPLAEGGTFMMREEGENVSLFCDLGLLPEEEQEEFFETCLHANLFGRGTFQSDLGISDDEKRLTLRRDIDYNTDYQEFMYVFEDFLNSIDTWGGQIRKT